MAFRWSSDIESVDWGSLSELYRIAPLGDKQPEDLRTVFGNSRFKYIIYDRDTMIGAGRALADGRDCSYICDVVIHPDYQGKGLGKKLVNKLLEQSRGHAKIILYTNPGKEGFYRKLGFKFMTTAMAIFADEEYAVAAGLIKE